VREENKAAFQDSIWICGIYLFEKTERMRNMDNPSRRCIPVVASLQKLAIYTAQALVFSPTPARPASIFAAAIAAFDRFPNFHLENRHLMKCPALPVPFPAGPDATEKKNGRTRAIESNAIERYRGRSASRRRLNAPRRVRLRGGLFRGCIKSPDWLHP